MHSLVDGEEEKVLDRHAWNVLILVTIFWIADGYDTFVLLITARPTLHDILPPEALPQFSTYLGLLVAITLAGWATGGKPVPLQAEHLTSVDASLDFRLFMAIISRIRCRLPPCRCALRTADFDCPTSRSTRTSWTRLQ